MTSSGFISSQFGNQLRIRVCGILVVDDRLLLIKHAGLGQKGVLWIPPGGSMEFGSDAKTNLKREFIEETGLEVEVGDLLFVHEHLMLPLHAVELFFKVNMTGGALRLGVDPEIPESSQILKEIRYISEQELNEMELLLLHNIFAIMKNKEGFISFENLLKFGNKYLI